MAGADRGYHHRGQVVEPSASRAHPLTEYTRYELIGLTESQAVGEQIRVVDLDAHAELGRLGPDSWLFDAGEPDAFAIVMRYDAAGSVLGYERMSALPTSVGVASSTPPRGPPRSALPSTWSGHDERAAVAPGATRRRAGAPPQAGGALRPCARWPAVDQSVNDLSGRKRQGRADSTSGSM